MKTAMVLLTTIIIVVLNACQTVRTDRSNSAQKAAPQDDSSDILIRHLLRRISDLTDEVSRRENEIVEHDNRCLEEQIAALEGHSLRHAKPDPLASANALGKGLEAGINLDLSPFLTQPVSRNSPGNFRHGNELQIE